MILTPLQPNLHLPALSPTEFSTRWIISKHSSPIISLSSGSLYLKQANSLISLQPNGRVHYSSTLNPPKNPGLISRSMSCLTDWRLIGCISSHRLSMVLSGKALYVVAWFTYHQDVFKNTTRKTSQFSTMIIINMIAVIRKTNLQLEYEMNTSSSI